MDFTNRGGQQSQAPRTNTISTPNTTVTSGAGSSAASSMGGDHGNKNGGKHFNMGDPKWMRVSTVVLLFAITILAISISFLFYYGTPNEAKYVDSSKYQAVFLANGQVYFGKVKTVNNKFVDLQNIYYLNSPTSTASGTQDTSSSTSNNFSLVKLGCELHGPTDEMIINRDQVTFWENLKSNGQVSEAIATWIKQNPNGQTCSTTTGSTQQSTGTSSTTGTTSTTGTSTDTTKK